MGNNARRIVISDVHGHYDTLMALLNAIAPSQDDQIYFLGDLIDRGPKSAQVVEFVKQNSYACLMGNHEQMMLDSFPKGQVYPPAMQAWLYNGGQETLESYGELGVSLEHLDWIQNLPAYLDLGDAWLVHAGVNPDLPIEAQTTQEFCWIRKEFHSIRKPYFADKLIVTGHTITFTLPGVEPGQIAQGQGWLDIETGAYHPKSGWMTALDINHKVVYQVNVFKKRSFRSMPLAQAAAQVRSNLIALSRTLLG